MSSLYCYLFYFSLARVVLHYGRVQMNGPNKTAMSPVHTDHSDRSRAWELVSSFVTSFEMSFTSSHSSFFWFSFSANAFAIGSKRTLKISRRGGWDSKCTLTQSWGSKVCVCAGGGSVWVGGGWAGCSEQTLSHSDLWRHTSVLPPAVWSRPYPHLPSTSPSVFCGSSELQESRHLDLLTSIYCQPANLFFFFLFSLHGESID